MLVSLQLSGAMHVLGDVVELALAIDPHDGHDDDCDRGDRDCPPGCPSCHTAHAGAAPIAPAIELRVAGAAVVSQLPAPSGTRDGPPAPTTQTLERPPRPHVVVS